MKRHSFEIFIWPLDLSAGLLSDIVSSSGCSQFIQIHYLYTSESLLPFSSSSTFQFQNCKLQKELFFDGQKSEEQNMVRAAAAAWRTSTLIGFCKFSIHTLIIIAGAQERTKGVFSVDYLLIIIYVVFFLLFFRTLCAPPLLFVMYAYGSNTCTASHRQRKMKKKSMKNIP